MVSLKDIQNRLANIWTLVALAFIIVLFIFSPIGRDFQAWLLGNPCVDGNIYDDATKSCVQVQVQLKCGSGSYLKYDPQKTPSYTCELSNFSLILIFFGLGFAAWLLWTRRQVIVWHPAWKCLEKAHKERSFDPRPGRDDFVTVRHHCLPPTRVLPMESWLFIGDFYIPGKMSSILINATTNWGWVERFWDDPLQDRQVNALIKQGMKLDQALAEVAMASARVRKAQEAFKQENEELLVT